MVSTSCENALEVDARHRFPTQTHRKSMQDIDFMNKIHRKSMQDINFMNKTHWKSMPLSRPRLIRKRTRTEQEDKN